MCLASKLQGQDGIQYKNRKKNVVESTGKNQNRERKKDEERDIAHVCERQERHAMVSSLFSLNNRGRPTYRYRLGIH